MMKSGLKVGCDRCGYIQFFDYGEDEENGKNAILTFARSDWSFKEGNHLCPDCTKIYNSMMHTFMKEVIK